MTTDEQLTETARSYGELVEFMVESVVDDGVESRVDIVEEDDKIALNIFVPDEERGQVIGRRGRIARGMRKIAGLSNIETDKEIKLDIVD